MIALKYLCNASIYKSEGIVINSDWEKKFEEYKQKHIYESINLESLDPNDNEEDAYPISKNLVHGYGEAHNIYDFDN